MNSILIIIRNQTIFNQVRKIIYCFVNYFTYISSLKMTTKVILHLPYFFYHPSFSPAFLNTCLNPVTRTTLKSRKILGAWFLIIIIAGNQDQINAKERKHREKMMRRLKWKVSKWKKYVFSSFYTLTTNTGFKKWN